MSDKEKGTIPWFFEMLNKGTIDNIRLSSEDGWVMIAYMKNRDAISRFKITINSEPGITLFQPIKP